MTRLPTTLAAFIWRFVRRQPWSFAFFFAVPASMVLEANVVPYALKMAIDAIAAHQDDRETIFARIAPALWLGGVSWLVLCCLFRVHNWWQSRFLPLFEAQVRMETLEQLMGHSHAFFADQPAGKLATKIADLPKALERIVMTIAFPGVSTLAVFATSMVLLAQVGAAFAWVFGVWMAAHALVTLRLSWLVQRSAQANAEDKSDLGGGIVDAIANMTSVRLFARRAHEIAWIGKQQAVEMASNRKLITTTNALRMFMDAAFLAMLGAIVYLLVTHWQARRISTGDLVYVFNMAWAVVVQMWFMGQALTEIFREIGVARQAIGVVAVASAGHVQDMPGAAALQARSGRIVFENVGFHYRQGNAIFADKSLAIEPGEKVGLVGFSGSGKTTFAHLILRFYDLAAGRILIDGMDISQVTQDSLRRAIAMVPQDAGLFHRTLMDNIRYARLDASDAQVIEASRQAHCHEFISRLPQGYDTLVGERGTKLSGGQRQRIAVARAFLKDAPILILDEATSALDSVTEKYIQAGLHELMQGRTAIVIAHRLSTLAAMDRVLVFDQGRVVEDGAHDELLARGGQYARMWRMQAGGFLPERSEAAQDVPTPPEFAASVPDRSCRGA